jgi:hypothetical protein
LLQVEPSQASIAGQSTHAEPQKAWLEVTGVQSPSQNAAPAVAQPSSQSPAWQRVPGGQTVPHPPQFKESASESTQALTPAAVHRSSLAPLPAVGHWHVLALHATPAGHATPVAPAQPPQLSGSVVVLVQIPEQVEYPVAQEGAQWPVPSQTWPAPQPAPQAPQFWSSERRFAQVPGPASEPPHAVLPAGHEGMQVPPLHISPVGQTTPHRPQLVTSVMRSAQVSGPASKPPQATVGSAQPGAQAPATQCSPETQAVLHAPQLALSLCRSTHVPAVAPVAVQ